MPSKNILIVDDDQSMRILIKHFLISDGYSIIGEASDGKEAILKYEKYKPDLVTMDINMPGVDGISATKTIKINDPNAKIIVMSVIDEKDKVIKAIKAGANNYILKPIQREKLLDVISKVMKESGDEEIKNNHLDEELNEKTDVIKEDLPPFSLENPESGVFIISINPGLNEDNYSKLDNFMEGLLYLKPLKVIFNFGDTGDIEQPIINSIIVIMRKIINEGGQVDVIASLNVKLNNTFLQYIKTEVRLLSFSYTYSIEEASDFLNVTVDEIIKIINQGDLHAIKAGLLWRIKEKDLTSYKKNKEN